MNSISRVSIYSSWVSVCFIDCVFLELPKDFIDTLPTPAADAEFWGLANITADAIPNVLAVDAIPPSKW